jgi:hypothetical protein
MNRVEIPSIEFDEEIPSHWDEMTPAQVLFCGKQAIMAAAGEISPLEAKVRCLYELLEIERDWKTEAWEHNQPKAVVREKNSKVVILSEQLCGFIFKQTEASMEVCYNTLTNHFPCIQAGKRLLYGPGDMLTGLTFGEFRTAMVHMQNYFEHKQEEHLSRFLACLYREPYADLEDRKRSNDWNGQSRVPFNADRIEDYAQATAQMSVTHRKLILLWFTFCIDFIKTKTIPINGVDVDFSILFEGNSSGPGTGWNGVLYGVAEKRIFGDADRVDRREWLEVLFFLYDKELENRRIKLKMKSK